MTTPSRSDSVYQRVLDVHVADGCVRLRSTSLALRIGGRRLPVPHVVRVTVDESFSDGRQHVDVRLRSPLVGEVFRYAGPFTYAQSVRLMTEAERERTRGSFPTG